MSYMSSFERFARQEAKQKIITRLLKNRFSAVDEELQAIIEPLAHMPEDDLASLLLSASRQELLARFSQNTIH